MKKLPVFVVSLAFAANGLAQTQGPVPAENPVQMAQAQAEAAPGGASQGAAPATSSGGTAGVLAVIAAAVAAVAAVTAYSSTTSTATNH